MQFIYDYYDCLPQAGVDINSAAALFTYARLLTFTTRVQAIAFVHGHAESWHNLDMRDTLASLHWGLVSRYVDLNRNQTVWTQAVKSLPSGPSVAPIATGMDAYNGTFPVGQVS